MGSTTDKQFSDEVTSLEITGKKPIPWIEWLVKDINGGVTRWTADGDDVHLVAAARAYVNSSAFGPHKFPLPGDIHVVTGGPPCQGWSGYNTTRPTSNQVSELMEHPENRLICRFMELCWFYKPLYVLMEEVPDVASKTNVMDFICAGYKQKGYQSWFEKRLRTGHFGCPQTRDRLIFVAAAERVPLPERPKPICCDFEKNDDYPLDELNIQKAFRDNDSTYPISVFKGRTNKDDELMRSLVIGDAVSCDLPVEAEEYGTHAGNKENEAEDASTTTCKYSSAPSTPYIAYLRSTAVRSVMSTTGVEEEGDEDEGEEEDDGRRRRTTTTRRRRATDEVVHNHITYALGRLDKMRCSLVPYGAKGVGWREMAGFMCSQKRPMMMVCDEDQWNELRGRWIRKIPPFMLKNGKVKINASTGMPELKQKWNLKSHRFPLVPYWCLTMKGGKDHGCYGRLSYDEPHPKVHSYHKPHWHPSLVPFAPRVMTVREKARIQGFADAFVFKGTVHQQYKQIANAVSPQLTKAMTREILCSLLEGISSSGGGGVRVFKTKKDAGSVVYSSSLKNFRDFMETFDDSSIQGMKRHVPVKVQTPDLQPMTYPEFIMEYNTEYRTDHSVRNATLTPFQVIDHCEANHAWHPGAILAIRWNKNPQGVGVYQEILQYYRGFSLPEWVDLTSEMRNTVPWKEFYEDYKEEVDAVMKAPVCEQKFPGKGGAGFAKPGSEHLLLSINSKRELKGNGYWQP